MARNKLRDTQIRAATTRGKLGDGDGLWLNVSASGSKSWVFIYVRSGRRREMGLGPYGTGTGQVSLADARAKADEVRSILGRGGDPFAEMEARRAAAKRVSFGKCADDFLDGMESSWRNDKHKAQWKMTLSDSYCASLRKIAVADISTDDVVKTLKPIWEVKNETASRLRGRIERVLDHARAKGLRQGENPARWKGHLDHILAARQKLTRGHHAAMPYADVPAFMVKLSKVESAGARALEFCVLTASRTSEVLEAKWEEIDSAAAVWTVPPERMKAAREHRVPLPARALKIVTAMGEKKMSAYIFPGQARRRPLSNMTMAKVLKALGADAFTVHGFRSSFRDWAAEETTFPREVAEAALAHIVGDATERAYRRGDALEKRRKLMDAWASYCNSKATQAA